MTPREKTLVQISEIIQPHGVTLDELFSKRRKPHMVAARRAVVTHYRQAGKSFPEIGRIMDRHHTTVMNLVYGKGWKYMSRRDDGFSKEYMAKHGEICA